MAVMIVVLLAIVFGTLAGTFFAVLVDLLFTIEVKGTKKP